MPRENSIREKALRQWAELQGLDLARVSNPKMGRGFFLVDWGSGKFPAGGPEGTLDRVEDYLRANTPQSPKRRSSKNSVLHQRSPQTAGGAGRARLHHYSGI